MAGTKEGGQRAAQTNKLRYGEDFYAKIGSEGGKKGYTGGVYGDSERAREIGAKGGAISKRGKTFLNQDSEYRYYMDNETHEVEKYAL